MFGSRDARTVDIVTLCGGIHRLILEPRTTDYAYLQIIPGYQR
jgi:hypothetical protein